MRPNLIAILFLPHEPVQTFVFTSLIPTHHMPFKFYQTVTVWNIFTSEWNKILTVIPTRSQTI